MLNILERLSLTRKLALGFGVVMCFMVLIAAMLSVSFMHVKVLVDDVQKEALPAALMSERIAIDTLRVQQSLLQAAASFSKDSFKIADRAAADINANLAILKDGALANGQSDAASEMTALQRDFGKFVAQGKDMADVYMSQGGIDAAGDKLKAFDAAATQLRQRVTKLEEHYVQTTTAEMSDVTATLNKAHYATLGLTAFAVVSGLLLSVMIARSIMRTVGGEPADAMQAVQTIARGDLSQSIRARTPASLMGQLEAMRIQLNDILGKLARETGNLVGHAGELAVASTQMANSAGQGSEAAGDMAATVEEMTVSISQVSDSAVVTAQTVERASALANTSGEVVVKLSERMSSLSVRVRDSAGKVEALGVQSENIRSIVSVIKEIADQTNLLALNAAIEAARAGESGRGFAVVADEVRKLAERTARSTQDISGMIESIGENVRSIVVAMDQNLVEVAEGERMATDAGGAIHSILTGTAEVVELVRNISNATTENASASQGVARNVEQIAQLSEENSNAAETLARTASQLNELAGSIRQQLELFRVA